MIYIMKISCVLNGTSILMAYKAFKSSRCFKRFGNIAVINDEVISHYGWFYSTAICNNFDVTCNSIPTPAFHNLIDK